jgi:hypothetical protein
MYDFSKQKIMLEVTLELLKENIIRNFKLRWWNCTCRILLES